MRVLALTRYERLGASSRLRFYQYIAPLREAGIDIEVSALVDDDYLRRLYSQKTRNWVKIASYCLTRISQLLRFTHFDLVWIEKEIIPNFPPWIEELISALGVPYIVDYDDAVFHNYDLSENPLKRLFAEKIDRIMYNATIVVCGNTYLAERARSAGARKIAILPTVIDVARYKISLSTTRRHIVVGWVGSPSTAKYLEVAASAFRAVSDEFTIQLRVIGATFSMTGVDVECRPWFEDSEVNEIQDFDIGIMPLIDGPWERGKCGYKLIQYMACGKPLIASSVGVNREIVEQGANGYLASDVRDWIVALKRLCANPGLRRRMGMHGRLIAERDYCIQITAPRLAQLFREAINHNTHSD